MKFDKYKDRLNLYLTGRRWANLPRKLMGLTLSELIKRYGNVYNLERYAKILKDLSIASEKQAAMELRQKRPLIRLPEKQERQAPHCT
jgi:hypothetical protein